MFAVKDIHKIVQKVNERSNGELVVKYLGGPAVISGFDLGEAVRKGVIQMAIAPTTYYEPLVPLAVMPNLSLITPEEELASGAWAFMNELHEKAGLHLLWRNAGSWKNDTFHPILTKKIESPRDFDKIKMGATATFFKPYLDHVGGTLTIIPVPEAYTSLERGVVDGFVWPLINSINLSFYEVAKYVVEPGFMAGNATLFVNLEMWNKLPKHLQDLLTEVAIENRNEYQVDWDNMVAGAKQKARDEGVEFIEFSPDDAEWYFNTIYRTSWEDQTKKYPDIAPKLKSLFGQ